MTTNGLHPDRLNITILGIGQMGLVCAGILSDLDRGRAWPSNSGGKAPRVTLWGHEPQQVEALAQTRRSPRLPGFTLAESVRVALKDRDALADADLIISAVPVQFSRGAWERLRPQVPRKASVLSVAKGIENGSLLRPLEIIAEVLGDDPDAAPRRTAALSGPTIAAELARCLPATMIAAGEDEAFRTLVQELFTTRWMRIYTTADVTGVELAGAMKNVIAIAAGILDGLQAGCNAKSALLARGLAEIARLGVAMGATSETFFGVAGAGDLATSCFSLEGRNRLCGEALGRGVRLDAYLAQSQHVVEGVATTRSVVDLARRHRVEMPITQAVSSVLFDQLDPIDAIGQLMTREPKAERVG
ncbi:MAG: NAD(P)H-dependent glycerol-3-phosphate dehydrogenase [Phycisphaerales bacterium]|nr:NAD(P)H-dependent glycerol-3-phosphate dehydrogenase [Phycisphaerales bacterium]